MKAIERPSDRVLVLFGATGDLAARKLFPGFFHLYREGLLPDEFRIIGSGRYWPGSDEEFREQINDALRQHGRCELDEHWDEFAPRLRFVVLERRRRSRSGAGGPGRRAGDRRRG